MEAVTPWQRLVALIEPHYPKAGNVRVPYGLEAMLRIHFMQQWFGLSDPAMEDALYDSASIREFSGLEMARLPDETTILNFRRLLERHGLGKQILKEINALLRESGMLLRRGTIMDATILHAAASTKNRERKRDPEMSSTKKGNQWYFGMKAHIAVDAQSGLVHSVEATAANINDVAVEGSLLHGEEEAVFGDAGYTGAEKREENRERKVRWHIAAKPSALKRVDARLQETARQIERLKASVRAKVEHPFRVIKRQFGHRKVRYRGLEKNRWQLHTLFALSNLWMARKTLLSGMEQSCATAIA